MAGASPESVRKDFDTLFREGAIGGSPDGRLLERFVTADGDAAAAAFEALVARHGPTVWRVCRRVLRDPHDAEDAFQATFLVLARRAGSVRRHEALESWLFGVALRVARRARVDQARRRSHERRRAEMRPQTVAADGDGRDDDWPDVYEELERLPEALRAPLVLCHLEGVTQAEAAARLGWTTRTLQRRLAEGRERVRARLVRRGVAAPAALLGASLGAKSAAAAAVPAALASVTARAAVAFGTGQLATAATAKATAWAQRVIRTMPWTELMKPLATLAAVLSAETVTAFGLTRPGPAEEPPAPPKAVTAAPAAAVPKEAPPRRAFEGPLPDGAERHVVEVRVADDATGAALPNAQVQVTEYVYLKQYEFPTDGAGRVRVEYPVIDPMAALEIRKEGYVPQRHGLGGDSGNPLDATLDVRLRAGTPIGGTVVDKAGRPIAGAMVVVTVSGYAEPRSRPKIAKGHEATYEVPVKTDDQGRWRCACVSPHATQVKLQLIHPDYVSGSSIAPLGRGVSQPAMAGLRAFTDRQVMTRGARVSGRVVDTEGLPIPGADVVDSTQGMTFLLFLRRTKTDADGLFHFHFDPNEQVTLTATAKGHAPEDRVWRAGPGEAPVEFRLPRGHMIQGRVVDHRDRPLSRTMVYISGVGRYKGVFLRTWTNAEGRFRWDEAPDDDVPLWFSKSGYVAVQYLPVRPSDRETVVVLKPALTVKGKVLDARTGEAIKSFSIETGAVDPKTGAVAWSPATMQWINEGEYRLTLDGTTPAHQFRVQAAGHEPFVSRVLRGDEGEVSHDVRLDAAPPR
jgi:RNA polymerase sigma factor (sigma-70 family)